MEKELRSFQDVVREISEKYDVPYEIVESILIDWSRIIYENMKASFSFEV
jgi:hypothetical protein